MGLNLGDIFKLPPAPTFGSQTAYDPSNPFSQGPGVFVPGGLQQRGGPPIDPVTLKPVQTTPAPAPIAPAAPSPWHAPIDMGGFGDLFGHVFGVPRSSAGITHAVNMSNQPPSYSQPAPTPAPTPSPAPAPQPSYNATNYNQNPFQVAGPGAFVPGGLQPRGGAPIDPVTLRPSQPAQAYSWNPPATMSAWQPMKSPTWYRQ